MKLLFLILITAFSSVSYAKNEKMFFTIGHHNKETLEVTKKEKDFNIRLYKNGILKNGKAITKETYTAIKKDWKKVFVSEKKGRKASSSCDDGIITHNAIICPNSMSKKQGLALKKYRKKLKNFATSKSLFYERL